MATHESIARDSHEEIATTMGQIKKMLLVGAVFAVVGYLLLIVAGIEDFATIFGWADSTKMWFKLGGVGHILIGVFVSLVAIVRTLSLVPSRLSYALEGE